MAKQRVCKACEPRKKPLDAPYPGPRCYRHHKARERELKVQAHARYVGTTYGLPEGFYEALLEAQGGRCAWCNLAAGQSRRLAVDHDHSCCPGPTSCGKCARGLLCIACNQFLGFQMRDNPEAIRRGARYLAEPPAQALLMRWTV